MVDFSQKSRKKETLSEEEYLGKPKVNRGGKNWYTEGIWNLWPLQLQESIKQSQINS